MLANVTYAIAGDHMPINRAYQPPTNKHVSQIGTKQPYEQINYATMTNCMQHDMQQVPRSLRTFEMMTMASWIAKSGA